MDETPLMDIGGSDDDERQFSLVRGVHRLSDGRIAVLDLGTSTLRFFDSTGALVARAGRRGGGPGEFDQQIVHSFTCGTDTVYVRLLRRVVAFVDARYARSFDLPPLAAPIACNGSRWLGHAWDGRGPPAAGTHRVRVALAWYDLDGRQIAAIDSVPFEDQRWGEIPGRRGLGYEPLEFGRRFTASVGPEFAAGGIGDDFEVHYWDGHGTVRRIARVHGRQRVVPAEMLRDLRDFVLTRTTDWDPAARSALDSRLTASNFPGTLPAFAEMHFDSEGNLWVREYDFADATAFWDNRFAFRRGRAGHREIQANERRWLVLDAAGRLLGEFATPARFAVHQVGTDWILGVWRDSLDVEHVRMHRVLRALQ